MARRILKAVKGELAGLWQRLRADPDSERERDRAASGPIPADDGMPAMTIDDILAREAGRYATVLHVISLASFRDAVGERWAKLADKVMLIGESVLHRHVSGVGSFGRQDDMFVLVFSRLTKAEAAQRAKAAATELGERLVGSTRFTGESLVHCAEVDAATALGPDGKVDFAVLAGAVTEARAAEAEERRVLAANEQGTERAVPGHGTTGDEARQPLRRHLQPTDWRADEAAGRRFRAARAVAAVADDVAQAAPPAEAEPQYGVEYIPTWIAAGEALGAHLCRARRQDGPESPVLAGAAAYTGGGVGFALDRLVAGTVTDLLSDPAALKARWTLVVPVHFLSLITRQRLMLTGIYARLPDAVRLLRLDFELFGLPDEPSAEQFADAVSALRPLGREVLVRTRPGRRLAALAADHGCDGLGIDLAELTAADRTPEALAALLPAIRSEAAAAGLAAHAWGLPSRNAVRTAAALGYARLNGPALARPVVRPTAPIPAPRARLIG